MTGIIISNPPTVEVPPGDNASNPSSLPPITYQYALLSLPQTWTAKQTFPAGNISINASDISGGTLPASTLPNPSATTLGGVKSLASVGSQWINSIGTDGTPTQTQPAFTDISGTIASAQITALPSGVFANPSASIGFSAANGTATTAMRSDATPALSRTLSDAGPTFAGLATVYNGLFVSTNGFANGEMFGNNVAGLAQTLTAGMEIPSSANFGNHSTGIAGYARTASTSVGAVGLYGQGTMNGSGTNSYNAFGANLVVTNAALQNAATNTGFNGGVYGVEIDINYYKRGGGAPTGFAFGAYFQNNGAEVQPSGGFDALHIAGGGTVQWKTGLYTEDGTIGGTVSASQGAINLGTTGTGNNVGSQPIVLRSRTSGGTNGTSSIATDPSGSLIFAPSVNSALVALTDGTSTSFQVTTGSTGARLNQYGAGTLVTSSNGTISAVQSATQQITPSNPAGTSSLTAVMMGLGGVCKLTPVNGTRIKIEFHIQSSNSAAANGMSFQCRFGTGTAPANGAAATGTTVGALLAFSSPGVSYSDITTIGGLITGLTPGTAYWFDFSHFVSGGSSAFGAVDFNAMEF